MESSTVRREIPRGRCRRRTLSYARGDRGGAGRRSRICYGRPFAGGLRKVGEKRMEAIQGRGSEVFPQGGALRGAARAAPARHRERRGQHLLVQGGRINSIRVGNLDGSVSPTSPKTLFDDPGRPVRGGDSTPRPARSTGRTGTRGRSRSRTSTARPATVFIDTLFTAPGNNLCGVAVDPAAGKIYWANFSTSEIRVGNLDGTGTASILFTDPAGSGPSGVAIDPAGGKIYWTNQPTDQVRVGNLNGSGPPRPVRQRRSRP